MKTTSIASILTATLLLGSVPACGGAVGEKLRPQDHSAAGAVTTGAAKTCAGEPKYAKPLIVDLDPDARVDLEAAMRKGVVLVNYDCANLRVLTACKLPDSEYEYAGVSRKEQVVQIKNADDLSANLPLSQAKLSAELKSGRSIDLALVLVGRRSTPVSKITKKQLTGGCDEATHYVQNATLGAFSMQTGSIGKVAAVADMFGRGATAGSSSERKAMNSDGSLDDCRTSKPDSEAPPTECAAPIRVELVPLLSEMAPTASSGDKKGDKEDKKAAQAAENPCPAGFAFTDGICTRSPDAAFVCNPKDESECKAQCDKGSVESCYNYGVILSRSGKRDNAKPAFRKACDGDNAEACAALGIALMPDTDEPGFEPQARESLNLMLKGCEMGSGRGCDYAGDMLTDSDYKVVNVATAVRTYDRGCSLGYGTACWSLSRLYFQGKLVPKDTPKGISLLNKACSGGSADECFELGKYLSNGIDTVSADPQTSLKALRRACQLDAEYCSMTLPIALKNGSPADAFAFAQRGCQINDEDACAALGEYYETGTGTSADAAKSTEYHTKACKGGDGNEKSCKRIGVPMKD